MALFKILKGSSKNLGTAGSTDKTTEGYAYFTPDDGKFYIDVGENGAEPVVGNFAGENIDGKQANRICINQRLFHYNDYDILDCGNAQTVIDSNTRIFDCGTSLD